jgi:hypothetical protein
MHFATTPDVGQTRQSLGVGTGFEKDAEATVGFVEDLVASR